MCQSRIVLSSTLALSFYVALVFLLVSAALLQGAYSKIERHMRGQRMRQKTASKEGWASVTSDLVTFLINPILFTILPQNGGGTNIEEVSHYQFSIKTLLSRQTYILHS